MIKRTLTAAVVALCVAVAACGRDDTSQHQAQHQTARTAEEFNEEPCIAWDDQGLGVDGVRQMVINFEGFEWKIAHDLDRDGYPCETQIGEGYLPGDPAPVTHTTAEADAENTVIGEDPVALAGVMAGVSCDDWVGYRIGNKSLTKEDLRKMVVLTPGFNWMGKAGGFIFPAGGYPCGWAIGRNYADW